MIIVLDTTTRKLQAQMGAAATTSNCTVTVAYAETTASSFTEGMQPTTLNGTNIVDILAAPSVAATRRVVKAIMIYNNDTVTQTVTVYLDDNGTDYPLVKVTLGPGANWASDDQTGVNVGGGVTDGNKGDIVVGNSGATWNIRTDMPGGAVTLAKMADLTASKLIGREASGSGVPQQIGATGGIEFTGTGTNAAIQVGAFSGDVSKTAGSSTLTITSDAVTYAKMQNVSATSRVIGRKTASAGDPEECTLSEVLDFVGSAAQGDLLYRGASTWTRLGAGTSGQYLQTQGTGANPQWAAVVGGGNTFKNRLINGSFMIDQRYSGVATTIANDAYCFDRWYVLRQSGNVQSSRLENQDSAPNTIPNAIRLTSTYTTAAQKVGLAQIIESNNCRDLRGKSVTLSFRVRTNVSSCTIRYAVLSWTNATADSVVSDVVNNWASTTYDKGNFFINNANIATITNPGTVTPTVDTWTTVTPLTVTLDSSITNVIVFVWTETALTASTGRIDLANVQLEAGSSSTDFEVLPASVVLAQCMYYAQVYGGYNTGNVLSNAGTGRAANNDVIVPFVLGTKLRVVPAVYLLFSGGTATSGNGGFSQFSIGNGVEDPIPVTNFDIGLMTNASGLLVLSVAAGSVTSYRPYFFAERQQFGDITVNRLVFDAEL